MTIREMKTRFGLSYHILKKIRKALVSLGLIIFKKAGTSSVCHYIAAGVENFSEKVHAFWQRDKEEEEEKPRVANRFLTKKELRLPEYLNPDDFENWLQHLYKHRKKSASLASQGYWIKKIQALHEQGLDVGYIIKRAIAENWVDLYSQTANSTLQQNSSKSKAVEEENHQFDINRPRTQEEIDRARRWGEKCKQIFANAKAKRRQT